MSQHVTRLQILAVGTAVLGACVAPMTFDPPTVPAPDHAMPEWREDDRSIVPKPRRPLSADEKLASEAVLRYRACPNGPTVGQFIDGSLFGGRLGVVHFRSGSAVRVSDQDAARYLVDVVIETHDAGYYGRPFRTEDAIGFAYHSQTGRVEGRDFGGHSYMESLRWECARETSPWRRGPPEDRSPVDGDGSGMSPPGTLPADLVNSGQAPER
jgi:hypothetical protein